MNTLLNPSHLKHLCAKYLFSPSKQFGQNYLISERVMEKILEAAALGVTDTVVEIGPGFGAITFPIAQRVKRVIGFEIEKKFEPYWEEKQKEFPNIEMVWGDALKKLPAMMSELLDFKVVANLPYQIATHLLRIVLEGNHKPERVVVLVQKEVAERICAKPGEMSVLSVAVQYYGNPRIVTKVPRNAFWPEPHVDSSVVCIETKKLGNKPARNASRSNRDPGGEIEKSGNRETGKLGNCPDGGRDPDHHREETEFDEKFFRVVKAGFANKRKQLWRNVSIGLMINADKVKKVIGGVVGNEKVRAQELTVDEWRSITEALLME